MEPALKNNRIYLDTDSFNKNGFAVLRNVINPELIQQILDEWEGLNASDRESVVTKTEPIAVFWKHVPGEKKRTRPLSEFPALQSLALDPKMADLARQVHGTNGCSENEELRLLETIVFNKPPESSPLLQWHQDNSFFPFSPNNQAALWIPLDPVDEVNGALCYVVGTHKLGIRASTNLHSGQTFEGDQRPPVSSDPVADGYEIQTMQLQPGDLSIHHGLTWHCSFPNTSAGLPRRALSLRYLLGKTRYMPNEGTAATFVEQVDVKRGGLVRSPAFPEVPAL